jgi:UV excision repair protein RAD23
LDANTPQALLRNIASVVKVLCYNNPSQLQNILLTLQQNSPELMELIRENEEEFKGLIQQPITDDDVKAFQDFNQQARGGQGGQGQGQGGEPGVSRTQDGREVIRLSKQDYDSVGRLKEMGFSEMDSVQAFFACDKNEEMAANLLWENKLRDQEQEIYIDCKLFNIIFLFKYPFKSFKLTKY